MFELKQRVNLTDKVPQDVVAEIGEDCKNLEIVRVSRNFEGEMGYWLKSDGGITKDRLIRGMVKSVVKDTLLLNIMLFDTNDIPKIVKEYTDTLALVIEELDFVSKYDGKLLFMTEDCITTADDSSSN